MKKSRKILDLLALALLLGSIAAFIPSFSALRSSGDTEAASRRATRIINHRLKILDSYISKALDGDGTQWMELGDLPSDMVIYRYCSDTLQSWSNEFPISNDDINTRVYVPFIANPRIDVESPLTKVTDSLSYVSIGPKWYLAKEVRSYDKLVIAGLEIATTRERTGLDTVNPKLRLGDRLAVRPLQYNSGSAVSIDGQPRFKILCESTEDSRMSNSSIFWIAVLLYLSACIVFLGADKSFRRFRIAVSAILIVMIALFFWGKLSHGHFMIFSPLLYAGNEVLYSLGAVLLVNLLILALAVCLHIIRNPLADRLTTTRRQFVHSALVVLSVAAIIVYTQSVLHSIILNSGITLELYKLSEISLFSLVVYVSFIAMLMSIPLLLQLLQPVLLNTFGIKFNAFSRLNRVLFSVAIATYLVLTSSILGFSKEQSRMEVLANRIAFDRDISLELRLKQIESQIADDMIISTLSVFNNTTTTIQSRISEMYLARIDREYTVTVDVFNSFNNTKEAAALYSSILKGGVPISDNSRFMYVKNDYGHSYYVGVFFYIPEAGSLTRVLVRLEAKDTRGNRGYAGIFNITPPGKVSLPEGYSYARYSGRDLKSYEGNYAYPTLMDDKLYSACYEKGSKYLSAEGFIHFITIVSDKEVVIISEARINVTTYIISGVFLALIAFIVMSLMSLSAKKEIKLFKKSYYKSRIYAVLLFSLTLTLLVMSLVSVFFVYTRNETNLHSVMSDKISSISSMIDAGMRDFKLDNDFDYARLRNQLEQISTNINTDITLYTPDGRIFMSTTPMVFNRRMLGGRISGSAYDDIVYKHRRYCIRREANGPRQFYSMYAPIMGSDGKMTAILCSPYDEGNYDFEEDAVTHTMTIFSLFLVFLLMALFMVSEVVDRMFKPLSEMSDKMSSADLDSLEYIVYERDDEISSLVQAYNRMVKELSESTVKLAQAERDKAWSGMARQVAHEIKNPLTPMKLQLQRVIRLKQNGNPLWEERFDEASKVILDHIDILTDTANEFSSFAKLYTEEPIVINLDQVLREEITMFDNKDNVHFDYMGLDDVKILGPKPQLVRVFVNLINNAVQAIDDKPDGHVIVSVRNSTADSFYDIVVEDNGAGVSEENVVRLFTPNFTTKSGGSGLGLAISRSILERSGATIGYSRSFSLGGACFTIRYPKFSPQAPVA